MRGSVFVCVLSGKICQRLEEQSRYASLLVAAGTRLVGCCTGIQTFSLEISGGNNSPFKK